jgi:hypothetical protein
MMESPPDIVTKIEFDLLNWHHPRVQQRCEKKVRALAEEFEAMEETSSGPKRTIHRAPMHRGVERDRWIAGHGFGSPAGAGLAPNGISFPAVREVVLAVLAEMVEEGWSIDGFNVTTSGGVPDIHVLLRRRRS